ncbi:MAG: Rieske (2Fe-2S) protein [Actinomycetes bacterium]
MDVDRRSVLQVGGLVAVGGVVAACSSGSSSTPAASSAPAASTPASAVASGSAGSVTLTPVADVPVGGGVILPDSAVVVTQPTEGSIKAFSAICTHQGCLVGSVVDNEIICPCHGSKFSGTDGSVITGPATQPLAAAAIAVNGGNVVLTG